jgi:chaperonin GroEL
MRFDRGYVSAYFCSNTEKMLVEMEHPQILLIDRKISSIHEILPVLQTVATTGRQLLIVAEDFDGDALSTLVVNRLRGTLKVAAVKSPGFGDRRKAMMQDIAVLTGATVISDEAGSENEITAEMLGSAEKISITKEHTTIINGSGNKEAIQARVKQIDNEMTHSTSTYDKEKLEERKAKLSGSVAVIRVGAVTEVELKPKKQLFEDSLNSTKAAIEGGIVPGGGVAFIRASQAIKNLKLEGDEAIGAKIVTSACEAPLRQLVDNTGFDGLVILAEVRNAKPNVGFNAISETVEDLVAAGIVDPAKVIKNALTYAASVAGIILISEALIGDVEDEE